MEDVEAVDAHVDILKALFLQDKSELKNVSPNSHQITESIDGGIEPPENFFDDLLKEEFLDSLAVVDAWSPEAEEKESNSKSKKDEDRGRRNVSAKRNERDNRTDRSRLSPRDRRVSPRGIRKRGRYSRSRSLDRNKRKRTPESDVHRRDRDSYKDRDRGSNKDDNDKDRGNNKDSHKDKDKGCDRDRGNNRDSHKYKNRGGNRDDNDKDRGNNKDSHKDKNRGGNRDDNDKDRGNNKDSHKDKDKGGDRDRVNNRDSHKDKNRGGNRDDNDKDRGNNDSHKDKDKGGDRDRGNNRDSHKDKNRGGNRDDNDKDKGNNRDSYKERDRGSNRDRTRNRDKEIDVDKERQRERDKDRDRNRYETRHNESSKDVRKRDSPRRDSYKHRMNSPMKDLDVEKFKSGNREVTGVGESLAEEGSKVNLDTLSQNYIPPSQSSEERDTPGDDSHINTSLDTCIKKLDDVLPPGTEYSFDLPRENISKSDKGKYSDESDCYKKNQDRSSKENWCKLSREEEIHMKNEESGMRTVQDRNMPENTGSESGSKDRSNKKSRWAPNTDKQDSEQDRKREARRSHSLSRETSIHKSTNRVDSKFSELDTKENYHKLYKQIKHSDTLIKDRKLRTPTLSPISDIRASSSTFEISPRSSEESVGRHSKLSFDLSPISSDERKETYVHRIEKQRKSEEGWAKQSSRSAPRKERLSFERSPERSKMSFERSPDRSKMSFERSTERKSVPFERSPERRRVPLDRSPERRRMSFERSPERRQKSFERSPERRRMSFERSPERRRMSFERSPGRRRKSFERSPERRRRSFERSLERRRRSFERSPNSRFRSRSRSKDRSSRYRKENSRHSPFSRSSSLSLSLSDVHSSSESLSSPRKRRRHIKRKRSPFLIELERKLAHEYANSKKEKHNQSLAAHPEMFNTAVGQPPQNVYPPPPMPYPMVTEPPPAYGQPAPQHQPGYPLHPMAPHPPPVQGHLGSPMVFSEPPPALPMQPINQMPCNIMPTIPVHMPPNAIPPNQVTPNMPQIPFPSGQAYPNVVPSAQVLPGSIPLNMAPPAPVPPPIYNVPPPNISLPYNVPPLNTSLAISSPNQGENEKSMEAPPPPPKISQILKEKETSLSAMLKSSEVNEMGKKQMPIRQGLVSRCEEVCNYLAVHGEQWLPLGHFLLRDLTTVFPRSEFTNLTSPILRTPVVELSFTKLPKSADVPEQKVPPQKEETALAQAYLESTASFSAVEIYASECSASTDIFVDTCPKCSSKTMIDRAIQVTPSVMNVGTQFEKSSSFTKFKPELHDPPTMRNRLQKTQMVEDEYIKKHVMHESLFTPKQEVQEGHLDLKEKTEDPSSPALSKILPPPRKGILKSSKPGSSEPQSLAQDVRSSNTSTMQNELSMNQVPQRELMLKMLGAHNLLTPLGLFQQYSSESELVSKLLELQNSVGGAQFSNALSGVLPVAVQQNLFAQLNALKSANSNEPRGDRPDEFQHPYCRDYNHGRSSRS